MKKCFIWRKSFLSVPKQPQQTLSQSMCLSDAIKYTSGFATSHVVVSVRNPITY